MEYFWNIPNTSFFFFFSSLAKNKGNYCFAVESNDSSTLKGVGRFDYTSWKKNSDKELVSSVCCLGQGSR